MPRQTNRLTTLLVSKSSSARNGPRTDSAMNGNGNVAQFGATLRDHELRQMTAGVGLGL
jgi:hypothetical protein